MYQILATTHTSSAITERPSNLDGLAQTLKSRRRVLAREKSKTFRVASRNQKGVFGAKWLLAQARADWQVAIRIAA